MKFKSLLTLLLAATVTMTAVPASAILITTDGSWVEVFGTPTLGPTFIDSDSNGSNDIIEFGAPSGSMNAGSSSYAFEGTTVDAPLDGSLFALGDFVHNNFTIDLPSITGANLEISIFEPTSTDFTILRFTHLETLNAADPCAAGGGNPCADLVNLPGTARLRDVAFEGVDYLLEIVGFSQDGGNTIAASFLTDEGASNRATLYARLSPVPEPGTLAMLGLGLFGVGALRKRGFAAKA